ncbi:NAD(P)H-binding protein [Amycolatopsis sp. NPDC051045]|uniref:NmrA family NAD(P)-binding protein n=1 Tax=Amycolatopsis sp. NPDC051045 TaxID=3156922 RepID=UPI0034145042
MADVLVLGGTGTTGRRVVAGLRAAGVTPRAATRRPREPGQVRFEWTDRATHADALRGASAVYLVAPIGEAEPAALVAPFLADALDAGVRRVVLLSSSAVTEDTPGIGELQRLVRAAPEWAVLKPSWFMQNFTGAHLVAQGVRDGEIVTATGDARVAFVDAGDIAAVAVRALTDPGPHNTEHVLTGPAALSYAEAAAIVAAHLGRPIRHRAVGTAEFAARLTASGMPEEFAAVLAALDEDIRRGAEDRVTPAVEQVTGRPARSFEAFVRDEIASR